MGVYEETQQALEHADHITDADAGTVAALLRLAEKIDQQTEGGLSPDGKLDNVTEPLFLKYADALGLTPVSRLRWSDTKKEGPGGSKLAQLQAKSGLRAV